MKADNRSRVAFLGTQKGTKSFFILISEISFFDFGNSIAQRVNYNKRVCLFNLFSPTQARRMHRLVAHTASQTVQVLRPAGCSKISCSVCIPSTSARPSAGFVTFTVANWQAIE
jgi:hypothetical protein